MPIRKVGAIILRIPRLISPRADSRSAWERAEATGLRVTLARCAAVIPPPPLPAGRSSCKGGSFAPRLIPQTSGFAAWTPPKALRLLDFRPVFRHRLRPGEPSCPPWTSRPGETSLSPWTLIDHGPCPVDPRRMRSAPAPLTNRRPVGCPACGAVLRSENKL